MDDRFRLENARGDHEISNQLSSILQSQWNKAKKNISLTDVAKIKKSTDSNNDENHKKPSP